METVGKFEWIIENFSHWCSEVHGECIQSPKFYYYSCLYMELYPKGIGGQGEHLVVRLCDLKRSFSGDLSFYLSDGSLLYKQQVNKVEEILELPLKFEDVLSRIREDFITVTLRIKDVLSWERRACTTINVLNLSLKINPKWFEEMGSEVTEMFGYIILSPDNYLATIELYTCIKNGKVCFMIEPPYQEAEYPFAVETSVSLTGRDDTVQNWVTKEHVFCDRSPWTFPYSLDKKKLDGKIISLFLSVKTKSFIQRPSFLNWDRSCFSIELNKTSCFHTKEPLVDPVTSNEVEVLTKDSGSQTSLTSDTPDDSVLSKDLMCLYQDQYFSDVTLKCDNVTFPVHKNILSARSPVFKTMLSTHMAEAASSEVDIGDLDPSTMSRFLTYLYTGTVEDLQDDRALKLYYAADKYQVPSLKRECSKFLCSNVSISNVCGILSLADKHQDDELTAVSLAFILDNFNTVLKSKEWDTLKKKEPLLALDTVTQFAVEDRVVTKLQPQ